MKLASLLLAATMPVMCAAEPDQPRPGNSPPPFDTQGRPNRSRSGPWDNDVLVVRVGAGDGPEKLAVFERAGVATVARLGDGRLIAAHQHFPEKDDANFDKVAVHFSSDEGKTWTASAVIRVEGLPEGMRFPFDPTLVPLPDGKVRMYFTSLRGRQFEQATPAIYSAISSDGVDYKVEPGMRFGVEGRPVIDCAVALHDGVFHLYSPDNGAGGPPGAPGGGNRPAADRSREGTGYHATSSDGLTFTRADDVKIDGARRWLGCAVSDGKVIRFFGSGQGVWSATSRDGIAWKLSDTIRVQGADPGAVRLRDGSWLLVATSPPRAGTPGATRRDDYRPPLPPPPSRSFQ